MWVRSLGQENPLGWEMATHSSVLAWVIPCIGRVWRAIVHGVAKDFVASTFWGYLLNNAAINIHLRTFVWIFWKFSLHICMGVEGHRVAISVITWASLFSKATSPFYISQQCTRVRASSLSHHYCLLSTVYCFLYYIILPGVEQCQIAVCIFILLVVMLSIISCAYSALISSLDV